MCHLFFSNIFSGLYCFYSFTKSLLVPIDASQAPIAKIEQQRLHYQQVRDQRDIIDVRLGNLMRSKSMMLRNYTLISFMTILSTSAHASSTTPAKEQVETRSIMAQMFSSLTNVLPLSLDSKQFSDPKNREKILGDLRKMRDGADSLVDHTKKMEGSYGFIAKSMSRDIKDIYKWYDKGAASESRYLLHQVSENCISCHLKLPESGQAPRMDNFFKNVAVSNLSAPEKARLQVALRQFDQALSTWEEMFKTWPKPSELFAMDALPEYLKVVLRVKSDSKRAQLTLEQLSKRADLPKFMSREVSAWIASLKRLAPDVSKKGNELERAEKIVQRARRTMEYPMDRTGLVDYIVASGLLNQFLSHKDAKLEKAAEAYYLLGITESLIGRSTWLTQTDYYFEAAVRSAPRSKIATKAFDALEQQVLMEYSGSGGTHIPEDVQANLEELRGMIKR